jgi:DNA-binding IclR family transcriptional regulator
MSALPAQPNHSLIEGIDVLFAVASRSEPVKVRELARELGYTPTRMQRYLATLASLGLCHRNEDRSYQVGPGIHALSAIGLSASGLTQRAVKVLREFGEPNYIIALGVLWRETVNYLYFRQPRNSSLDSIGHNGGYPADRSSIGRLLMSYRESDETSPESHHAESAKSIREQGYLLLEQKNKELSLAVPVGTPPMAGLAISGHFSRGRVPELVEKLKAASAEIEV